MHTLRVAVYATLLLCVFAVAASADDRDSVVLVFKDGHRQTFAAAEIARLDLKAPAAVV